MSEKICNEGHVMRADEDRCPRCNGFPKQEFKQEIKEEVIEVKEVKKEVIKKVVKKKATKKVLKSKK